jgi:excisionase family DNA binding protein
MAPDNNFFTIPQAAKHCSISRVTLWRWVKSGKVKAFLTPGGQYRIREEDLESFIQGKMGYLSVADLTQEEKKILIVDDDPEIQKILASILSLNNYQTEVASDGLDAGIKIMRFKPDLIILDLYMPQMDGFEVCRRIKENLDHSHIKILILTGYDSRENRDQIIEAGADAYLSKPVKKDDLLHHIQQLFNNNGEQTLSSKKEVIVL